MADEATTQDPVEAAKAEHTSVKAQLKQARAAAKTAKSNVTTATNALKSADEGDQATQQQALTAAELAQSEADEAVTKLVALEAEAKAAVKSARDAASKAKKDQVEQAKAERANRPRKAPLTLSQRRAVLNLSNGAVRPRNAMNQTPLDYLVGVGLAQVEVVDEPRETPVTTKAEDGTETVEVQKSTVQVREYTLTDAGRERAGEVNPKWLGWKPERPSTAASDGDTVASEETAVEPTEDAVTA